MSLEPALANRLVAAGLEARAFEELEGWRLRQREFVHGHSRFDFLLERLTTGETMLLEVKSVTLVEDSVGMFPDAVTKRGTRHLRELCEGARSGAAAAVLFIVQRSDARCVRPAVHIDPAFGAALAAASSAGVRLLARSCSVSLTEITLGPTLPVEPGR